MLWLCTNIFVLSPEGPPGCIGFGPGNIVLWWILQALQGGFQKNRFPQASVTLPFPIFSEKNKFNKTLHVFTPNLFLSFPCILTL